MAGISSHDANSGVLRPPTNGSRTAVEGAVVVIVSVEVADVVPGVMVVEGDEQMALEGSPPVQESVTIPLKLLFPVTTIW
jgi:hypothetical protein